MTPRRVIRRQRARQDIEAAAWWYANEAGTVVAERFVAAVERAMGHVASQPTAGSRRYTRISPGSGLRFWRVCGFPYLVFYVELDRHIDVWRVLHAERDIPQRLQDKE